MKSEPLIKKKIIEGDRAPRMSDVVDVKSIAAAVAYLKSEPVSLCLRCFTRWDGLIKVCEKCGAKYSEDAYKSEIEYFVAYDGIDEAFQVVINERHKK